MNSAYLIVGGNKGDKLHNIEQALYLIDNTAGKIITKSSIYITAAWGNKNQPDFFNQVILIHTPLTSVELLKLNLKIEESLGRVRTDEKWMERTMDIDILFYNNEIINSENLTIPHPFIQDRKFVLIPLNEIAHDFIHPIVQKSISTILTECNDDLEVSKYNF